MTTYTLKLVSGVNYNLYDGATLVSDSDLATLFGSAGSAFFVFDFNGGTPTNTTSLTIVDSNSTAVMTNTGLTGIAENINFNGEWSASATAFDTFVKSPAAVLDEAQMSDLMEKIKEATEIKSITVNGNTDLYDRTLYPDGIYKVAAGQYSQLYLTQRSGEGSIHLAGGTSTFVALITTQASYRLLVGIDVASSYPATVAGGIKVIYANYATASTVINTYTLNNLTSTSPRQPLSAAQGKILNENIGDITTLTTTTKTSTVAAINELVSTIGNVESALNVINNGSES